jgi:uncharacterized DUF497 family protein
MKFEWDPSKAEKNQRRHDVSFDEAASVFAEPLSSTLPDPEHSSDEERWLMLGTSRAGRLLLVWYTEREDTIRIIGAREPTPRERRSYER